MLVNWKNQYYENGYTTQSNLEIQCHPYQIANDIFQKVRTKKLKICMETQKTLNSQSNLEEEKPSWRNQPPLLQTILKSYSNQDCMILAQRQKYGSMEQDRKLRDKSTHLWSLNLWQSRQEYIMEKKTVSSISSSGKTGQLYVKNEIRILPNIITKTQNGLKN